MIISNLTELNSIDDSCYMPVDVAGDAKKIKATLLTPVIENNLTTSVSGHVLDASQGKILNDAIEANAQTLETMQASIDNQIIFKSEPWILYRTRTDNAHYAAYPSTANEVMVAAWDNTEGSVFTSLFIPGAQTDAFYLHLGGFYQLSYERFGRVYIQVDPENNRCGDVKGIVKFDTATGIQTLSTSSDWTTQIWYR